MGNDHDKTVTVTLQLDYYLLEELNTKADGLNRDWAMMVNLAIKRLLNDIDIISELKH